MIGHDSVVGRFLHLFSDPDFELVEALLTIAARYPPHNPSDIILRCLKQGTPYQLCHSQLSIDDIFFIDADQCKDGVRLTFAVETSHAKDILSHIIKHGRMAEIILEILQDIQYDKRYRAWFKNHSLKW